MRVWVAVFAALLTAPVAAHAADAEKVAFPGRDGVELTGLVYRPEGTGRFPGIIALHGCGGLLTSKGVIHARERAWAERWTAAGYAVLFPDSFTPRGVASICSDAHRPILPERERVRDAYDALAWFEAQPYVAADRIALFGWSHGAMTTLWAMAAQSPGRPAGLAHDFIGAVAFYPGCAQISRERPEYAAVAPMLLQLAADDVWTPPAACIRMVEAAQHRPGPPIEMDVYPDSVHGFDQPTGSVHSFVVRNSIYRGGEKTVYVGANPAARERAIARVMPWLASLLGGPAGEGGVR